MLNCILDTSTCEKAINEVSQAVTGIAFDKLKGAFSLGQDLIEDLTRRGCAGVRTGEDRRYQLEVVVRATVDESSEGRIRVRELVQHLLTTQKTKPSVSVALPRGGDRREGARLVMNRSGDDPHALPFGVSVVISGTASTCFGMIGIRFPPIDWNPRLQITCTAPDLP